MDCILRTFTLFLLLNASYTQPQSNTLEIVDEVFALLKSGANFDYIGESISQLDHALQCAQQAIKAGSDDETIIAALFHDIGHLCAGPEADQMDGFGVAQHETIGAQFLKKRGFSKKVQVLIAGHVDAKRYLTFKDPAYYNKLSDSSKETLQRQGGPMSAQEAAIFEQSPYFKEILFVRFCDEKGKVPGAHVPSLETYRDIVISHLERKNT